MSAWGLALAAACPDFAGAADPNRVRQQVPDPAFCTLYPLDDETVRRHAGPLTTSFHPAARACQHGEWHLLLPVPSLHAPPTQTGSGSKCQTLPSARFTRSMMKQCGGTLVRSRRPFIRPPAHVSMGTGTCCLYPSFTRLGPKPGQAASARPCLVRASPLDDETVRRHAGPLTASFLLSARACQHGDWHLLLPVPSLQVPRTRTGSGSKCQALPVVRASPLDDETVRRHDCLSTRTARKGCPCCSPATCPGQASGDRNPAVTMPASPAPRLAGP